MAVVLDATQQIIYLAGHFDGEGSIYMRKRSSSKRCRLTVSVTGAYRPTLDEYQRLYGGAVHPSQVSVNKQLYQWALSSIDECHYFLKDLLPYLNEKFQGARIALDYLNERKQYSKRGYSGSPEKRQYLDELSYQTYILLKSCKHPNEPCFSPALSGVG